MAAGLKRVDLTKDALGRLVTISSQGKRALLKEQIGGTSVWLGKRLSVADVAAGWDDVNNLAICEIVTLEEHDVISATALWHDYSDSGKRPYPNLYVTDGLKTYAELTDVDAGWENRSYQTNIAPNMPYITRHDNDAFPPVTSSRKTLLVFFTNDDNTPPESGSFSVAVEVIRFG